MSSVLKCNALYKKEIFERKRSPKQWHVSSHLASLVLSSGQKLMRKVRMEGKFVNHSLPVSAATGLYQKGCNEQMIKQTTGDKSDCEVLQEK